MSDPGSGYGKVFGRFTEPAHRVLGPGEGGAGWPPLPWPGDAELLGSLGIDLDPVRHDTDQSLGVRAVGEATWRVNRQIIAHLGLPECYRGAAGLLAALEVDPDRLREAVTAEPGGVQG